MTSHTTTEQFYVLQPGGANRFEVSVVYFYRSIGSRRRLW